MIVILALAIDVARVWHDLNAYIAGARGAKQFQAKQYATSAASFDKANAIKSTPARQFNLGTAEVASGDRERGAAALDKAMSDPRLRADALYNRGTSALGAKAYDSAIRDFASVLRLRPHDVATKRNLEIALARKQAADDAKSKQGGGGGGATPQPSPKPPQQGGAKPQPKSDANRDAVLRSVQEQEKEELSRMHRGKGERTHVGW